MKLNITRKNIKNIIRVVIILCSVGLIFQLMPRRQLFRYQFEKGRPWQYSLLMSPYDFPILKSESILKVERDSILKFYSPYFRKNTALVSQKVDEINEDNSIENSVKPILKQIISDIYQRGIIDVSDKQLLNELSSDQLFIVDGIKTNIISTADIFTIKSAYEYLDSSLSVIHFNDIRKFKLGRFLSVNLIYDEQLSVRAKEELLSKITLSEGMVQKGVRIIGPGEIVDEQTFEILNSLKSFTDRQELSKNKEVVMIFGEIMFVVGILLLLMLYLLLFRPQIAVSNKDLIFIMLMVISMVALTALVSAYTDWSIYIVPFALSPIIVRIFFDSRTALFVHIITTLLVAYVVSFPLEFIVLQITAGMTAVSSLKNLTQRSQLVRTASLIFLTYSFMYTACVLMLDGDFYEIQWTNYLCFLLSSFMLLFAYVLIFIFEKLFGFLSDITLVELSNVNNKLLLKFAEVAPGTFQHSLQVANLATEAAKSINANVLLARTGALYHDIGKISNPQLFTENQFMNINPLSELDFEQAAQIIISHVSEGVKIAEKNNLPNQIIDFIRTHHGEGKTKFFYNSFKNNYPDRVINEQVFSYQGPLPSTKEQAILMMADAVEATSKSLTDHSEKSIDKMVDEIIDKQIAEGALKDSPITFRHVEKIKGVFKEKLKRISHVRISYPELKNN